MIAWPAVDLKGGRVVQLVGGRPETERVSLPDPVEVARGWLDLGFRALHVIDLDAALGTGAAAHIVHHKFAIVGRLRGQQHTPALEMDRGRLRFHGTAPSAAHPAASTTLPSCGEPSVSRCPSIWKGTGHKSS